MTIEHHHAAMASLEGVEIIGAGVAYADGAEDDLLQAMLTATDRSSGSDELGRLIVDWPTKYHLSHQRANLLLPLALRPGMRVLDVGCGTGALTRRIAESGADVIGLEGSLARARVAAARTQGMDQVRIVAGTLAEFVTNPPSHAPQTFDLVVVSGVLEYSGAGMGGSEGPARMLAELRGLIGETGALALAIENRWGLKYLLSHPEDHLGQPWVGVEGYWRDRVGIRTWSRRELSNLLTQAGMWEQAWFAAYPDYKLPTAIVRDDMFETPESAQLIKLFVRTPITDDAGSPVLVADPLSCFHSALDAGLGMELANSFLVVAGSRGAVERALTPAGIHLGVPVRAREWRRTRTVSRSEGGWRVRSDGPEDPVEHWPLRFARRDAPVVVGENALDIIRHELMRYGVGSRELNTALRRWWVAARAVLSDAEGATGQFDVLPANFVVTQDDSWEFVDPEFVWQLPLAQELVGLRAMLWTAVQLIGKTGSVPGCSPSTALASLAESLSHNCGIRPGSAVLGELIDFESRLQAIVAGDASAAGVAYQRAELEALMARPLRDFQRGLPLTALHEHVGRLAQANARANQLAADADQLIAKSDELTAKSHQLTAKSDQLTAKADELTAEVAQLQSDLRQSRATIEALLNSRRWRLAEAIRHPRQQARSRSPRRQS